MTEDAELRAYVEAEFSELADALDRKDAAAATQIIKHIGAEGDPRLMEWVEREITIVGMTRLAERAHRGEPGALEALGEALRLLMGQ
jgi:hypothetical protein